VDNSALDGYACRYHDTIAASREAPAELELIGEIPAGKEFQGGIGEGQAVAIFTGAPLPAGADAIAPVEHAWEEGGRVLIEQPANRNAIRLRGQDLEADEVYLAAGRRLSAASVGLAAAMGHAAITVTSRPRIAVLATGNELVEPGGPLQRGQVYNANEYALAALVEAAGGEAVVLPPVGDDAARLAEAFDAVGRVDLLLTSGGVSMGRYDFVRDLLFEHGEVLFWKVAIRPGGPVLFGRWRETLLLGLPGNPVSSMVVFLLLGKVFTSTFLRSDEVFPYQRRLTAEAASIMRASAAKETFQRVKLQRRGERLLAMTTGNQSSGIMRSMVEADALAVLDPGRVIRPGAALEVIPLSPYLR